MIWHLTLASTGRLLLFPDIPSRSEAVQRVARHSAGRVVLFSAVDDHLHLVLRGDRSEAGRLGGILGRALAREEVGLVGLEGLERAAAGASGLARVGREHTPVQTRARRALAALARGAGIPVGVLARHLGVTTRSLRRWRVVEEEELVTAARTWLDLSELLHRSRA